MDKDTEEILDWWNSMSLEEQFYKVIPWLNSKDKNVTSIHPNDLTILQIKEIYKKFKNART